MAERTKIYLGGDHAGFALRGRLATHLRDRGYEVADVGAFTLDPEDDYPDFAAAVGRGVRDDADKGAASLGVLVCGSGAGVCIAANKFRGVRAAAATSRETAHLARSHNDANVMCVGARLAPEPEVIAIVDAWLDATFEGGRHARRVDKISAIEEQEFKGRGGSR